MSGKKAVPTEPGIHVQVRKSNAHFRRIHERGKAESGAGKFFLLIDITAPKKDVFVPVSIASGKKPTGFIYEIVGTAEGIIATTNITSEGDAVSQITLGTIVYCKIPAMKTGTFRVQVETRGKIGGEYKVVINRINYKYDPSDARYEKLVADFESESVRFG